MNFNTLIKLMNVNNNSKIYMAIGALCIVLMIIVLVLKNKK